MIELVAPESSGKSLDERIIPMINVIFLLLLFFLIAGSMTELVREDVHPPRSDSARVGTGTEGEWLLTAGGELIVGERHLAREQWADWLADTEAELPRQLRLRADARTRARQLLPLLQLLRERGVRRIALVSISDSAGG